MIGFRTWKECKGSSQIIALEPIFYSVDRDFCENYVVNLTENLKEEVPAYGKECSSDFMDYMPSLFNFEATETRPLSDRLSTPF